MLGRSNADPALCEQTSKSDVYCWCRIETLSIGVVVTRVVGGVGAGLLVAACFLRFRSNPA